MRRSPNQTSSGTPTVISVPGIGPIEPASDSVQLGDAVTGFGTSSRLTPERMKNVPSVAITGGIRRRAIITPLIAPIDAPMIRRIGTASSGPPSTVPNSFVTSRMLVKPISGATERSMPAAPVRNAGVLAIPAIANGASVPSVGAHWLEAANAGCTAVLAMNRITVSAIAKPDGRSRAAASRAGGRRPDARVTSSSRPK